MLKPLATPSAARGAGTQSERVPLPGRVKPLRVLWQYAIPITVVHVLALAACWPWLFSWTGLILCVVGVYVYGQAINLYYHRLLAHRSLVVPVWLERVFTVLALCCLEDTPARWVATHRFHHNHADEQVDPHSPLVAFLWAHIGWLLVRNPEVNNTSLYRKYASDVLSDPFYMRLEKRPVWALYVYLAQAALYFLIGAGVGWASGGTGMAALRCGLSLLVWGVIVRTVLVWHITWSVNSLTHLFGYRSHETGENSRNNWFVALISQGEGWHNNHHDDPAAASVQQRWWEIDVTYYHIRLLEMLGLARQVVRPRRQRRAPRESTS